MSLQLDDECVRKTEHGVTITVPLRGLVPAGDELLDRRVLADELEVREIARPRCDHLQQEEVLDPQCAQLDVVERADLGGAFDVAQDDGAAHVLRPRHVEPEAFPWRPRSSRSTISTVSSETFGT
jgi:hypothetical protein